MLAEVRHSSDGVSNKELVSLTTIKSLSSGLAWGEARDCYWPLALDDELSGARLCTLREVCVC